MVKLEFNKNIMVDKKKIEKLAKIIVNYSLEVKEGEKVLLKGYGFDSYPLIKEIYRECLRAGALEVAVRFSTSELGRIFMEEASEKQLTNLGPLEKKVAASYDAMVQIVADENRYELTDVDPAKMQMSRKAGKPISDILHQKKWCLFYYPTVASAAVAKRNVEEWEDFVLDSCLLDWKKVEKLEIKLFPA